MYWFGSGLREQNQQALLKENKNTKLHLEKLESRQLLAADPYLIEIRSGSSGSNIDEIIEANGTAFFSADDGENGRVLWISDGTSAGTEGLADEDPDLSIYNPEQLTNADGTVYFRGYSDPIGIEVFFTDGTVAGTVMTYDLSPGPGNSTPSHFANVGSTLFFAASNNSDIGKELFKSDGTSGGTGLVKDIRPGSKSSSPLELTEVNGTLFFTVDRGPSGGELYISDGTGAGTQRITDIRPGGSGSQPRHLTNVNGTVFFYAFDGGSTYGRELWMSDGTTAGTQLVKDIKPAASEITYQEIANVNGTAFFIANDEVHGYELWRSDGTSAGTILVQDIQAGSGSSIPHLFRVHHDTLFFLANDGTHGDELWMSDGTSAGTMLVADINAGMNDSSITEIVSTGSVVYFSANDGVHGTELWVTDGTSAGTMLVSDIRSGSTSSNPSNLTNVNGALFFSADDGVHGRELWVAPKVISLTITPDGTSTNSSTTLFTFEFSTDVTGFDSSDITLTNATAGAFSAVDGNTYTLEVTAIAEGDVIVVVAEDSASDGSASTVDGGSATITYDATAPTLSISPDGGLTNSSSLLFTFEFNEDVTGFESSDISITNGSAGSFTAVDGNTYTLEVTPTADGDVTVSVLSTAAQDEAGNEIVGDSATVTYDGTSPTLAISPDGTSTNNDSLLFTFEFSEEVVSFVSDDITVTNGTKGTFSTVDGNTYTLLVTAAAEGFVTVSVSGGVAQDAVGNDNVGDSASVDYDITSPSVVITPDGTSTFAQITQFTIQFSEGVTGFTLSDIEVTNGAVIGGLSASNSHTYKLFVQAASEGLVTISVASDVAQDAAGNGNLNGEASITYDVTDPTLVITPDEIVTNDNPILFTFEFDEEVTGFEDLDIFVFGGTKGTFTAIDGNTYTIEVTPNAEGEVEVSTIGIAQDAAGNPSNITSATATYDSIAPSLSITPAEGATNASPILFTFAFTEEVTGFESSDIVLYNGTAGTFTTIDASTYTLEVTPNSQGLVTVTVAEGAAQDEAGNGTLGDSVAITFDTMAPTLEITPEGIVTNDNPILFTFEFSEEVTGFVSSDISATGGTKGTFTTIDGNTYTLEVTPSADGDVTVSVLSTAAQDEAGNDLVGDSATVTYDGTSPSLEISAPEDITNNQMIVFTFEFSEEVSGFDSSDIMITNGSAGTFTVIDANTYTLAVEATADGEVIVTVTDEVAQDAAANGNTGDSKTVLYDGTAPTLSITPDGESTNEATFLFTFEFSEDVVSFISDDILVTNGTAGAFTTIDDATYTLEVTAVADGEVTVSVAGGVAQDLAGNENLSEEATISFDGTGPSLVISPDGGSTPESPIVFSFEFSEDVVDFDASDIEITNGTAGTFSVIDGNSFTLEVIPDAEDAVVMVSVAQGAAQDALGNDSEAASASIEFNAFEEQSRMVTGSNSGDGVVRVFDESGTELYHFYPYTEAFTGGVRVATGDINGDGILDIVTAAGPSGGPHIQVFDSETGELITGGPNNFYAYAANITVGVFVAVGDVNDDGFDDIITSPDASGGPHIKVFSGQDGSVITEFYAYASNITVGVRVAAGDVDGDGTAEVITAPGPGGGPHVRVFSGTTGMQMSGAATNFYAYASNVTTGLFVASGDVNDDGLDDIITAPDAGGGPHVKVFSSGDASLLQNFYAYDPAFIGGVRVGSADVNQDGFADILTVPGSIEGPEVKAFSGIDLEILSTFFSGSETNPDGLFITGGISSIPIDPPTETSALVSSTSSENSETPEDLIPDNLAKKKSWWEDADEFYQSAEEIDKLFSNLWYRGYVPQHKMSET
ncbi:Hypothetical protein PBC10988_16160 [Planctomycetales bacterium 10988]|nr:Hypothetical protein PBC10988_16160 [Planctomycetales bacterium 10988]